ncbi:MAG: precorrin-6Y C5,15-methyltransferase (decarboxylating) subunit CbiT [Clostridiales bacterium]|nr:precorrin-6Y C5,15-methyltransferase (decarboxylating) subunit CbiT [Clostridiales bacterium]
MRDEDFIRGKIPMTKSEIRAISLSKLEWKRDSIIYDIGAGTGSVSVEVALAASDGRVFAFECREEGCDLIRQNAERFGVNNLTVVGGMAPETFQGLPAPDCALIGGSRGFLDKILDELFILNPEIRVVLNIISLETLAQAVSYFENRGLEPEVVSVTVAKAEKTGKYHLMKGQNPVYVISVGGSDRFHVDRR